MESLRAVAIDRAKLQLSKVAWDRIQASRAMLQEKIDAHEVRTIAIRP